MKRETAVIIVALILTVVALFVFTQTSSADSATTFNNVCADCHEVADFEGVTAGDLLAYMLEVNAGEARHPELGLTNGEAALMAEYLSQE